MMRVFQWLGGAMFVASLAICVWWYAFVLERPVAAGGAVAAGIDIALFSLFALHHSLFSRAVAKDALARVLPGGLIRPLYVWTASLLLILVCLLWQPVGGELYAATGWRATVHGAVQLAGLGIVAVAAAIVDPLELAGIHQPSPGAERLRVIGPYRLVRHPIYLGWILATFGAAHMTGDRLLFSTVAALYLAVAVPFEERSLANAFGRDYAQYRRRVRWRIVPFVY